MDRIFNFRPNQELVQQIIRYGVVGILLNFFAYFLYLAVTSSGLTPEITICITYPIGVIFSYFAQAKYTFQASVRKLGTYKFLLFFVVYLFGFLLNLFLLFVFYNQLGYPHQWVQLSAIFVVASFLFFSIKKFVFSNS